MKSSVLLTWEIPDTYNPAQPFTVSTGVKTRIILALFNPEAQAPYFTRSIAHCADPLRQWPECGGGREANAEADHRSSAGDAVLLPPDQPGQQRWWPAAPCVRHDCTGYPSHKAILD